MFAMHSPQNKNDLTDLNDPMENIMKHFALLFFFLSPVLALAQASSSVCKPVGNSSLDAGMGDTISKIQSLEISYMTNNGDFTAKFTVLGHLGIDASNGDKTEKQYVEIYSVKENKSGMMYEMKGSTQNSFEFTTVLTEFGPPAVNTAGPILGGTYHQMISFAFIDSNLFYKNPSPMKVKKIAFDCQTTYL
jgi:hypothetical protein